MPSVKVLEAELPYPVGVNATYKQGQGNFYKDQQAKDWVSQAVKALETQGFAPVEKKPYWCSILYTLYTNRMDVDGPVKAIVDSICEALSIKVEVRNKNGKKRKKLIGFDDTWLGEIKGVKYFVNKKNIKLVVRVILIDIEDKESFEELQTYIQQYDSTFERLRERRLI